jgi:hypothetical protein
VVWYKFNTIFIFTYVFLGSGATNPEYVVTADDVDKLIAVECIPMDDKGRQVWNKLVIHIMICHIYCIDYVSYGPIYGCYTLTEIQYFNLGYEEIIIFKNEEIFRAFLSY